MKTLPDNPHIDHLRRQAKDLLAGLRDTDPTASLADAQASLAEQYGFRTWTDLKAEVDRRCGLADVADEELARAVAERYGLGEVTGPMRSLARADESGRQWSLQTRRGRWMARTMDTWWPIVDVETEVALQLAAAGEGILLPAPVRSGSGAIVESIGGHTWRVYEWINTGPPLSAPVGSATCRKVGAILATIHRLALPVDRISPWHAGRFATMGWPELADLAEARGAPWAPAMRAAATILCDLDATVDGGPPPEPVLCHNSLGPARVRLAEHGRPVVVGWEHAGGLPPGWELCDALMTWTINPSGGVNAAGARAMIDGYRSVAHTLPPLDRTMFRGAVNSVGNYVSGQVHEALDAKDEEDRRYTDRNVRHLLTHLPTSPALERLLELAA